MSKSLNKIININAYQQRLYELVGCQLGVACQLLVQNEVMHLCMFTYFSNVTTPASFYKRLLWKTGLGVNIKKRFRHRYPRILK